MDVRTDILAAFFASFEDGLARDRRRAVNLAFAGFLTLWTSLVGLYLYLAWPVIVRTWPDLFTGQFSALSSALLPLVYALFPILLPAVFVAIGFAPLIPWRSNSLQAFNRALLDAVAARDGAATRTIVSGSVARADVEAHDTVTIAGLAHPAGSPELLQGVELLAIAILGLVLEGFLGFLAVQHIEPDLESLGFAASQLANSFFVVSVFLFGITYAIIQWWFFRIARDGFTVAVDETGLTVRRAQGVGRERRVAWEEARGLARFTYYRKSSVPTYTYILDAASERVIWEEPSITEERADEAPGSAWERRERAQRLVALVQRHTGLPLLDFTGAVYASAGGDFPTSGFSSLLAERALTVALVSGDHDLAAALLARLRPAGPFSRSPRGALRFWIWLSVRKLSQDDRQNLLSIARTLLPYYPNPGAPLPPTQRFLTASWLTMRYIALIALIVVCIFPFWSGLTPAIMDPLYSRPRELAALARVPMQKPLYFAALTTPAPGWRTHAATKTDPSAARFTPHGYELAFNGDTDATQPNIEWNPTVKASSDGAIMVTVSPSQSGGPDKYSDLVTRSGVLFDRSADGSSAMHFHIDILGDWGLARCQDLNGQNPDCDNDIVEFNDIFSTGGQRAPRPHGATTFNLLLIRNGRTYLLYANGAFLTAYHDDTGPAAPSGAIGLYLNEFGEPVRFTNLAIYPVPPNLPFWAR